MRGFSVLYRFGMVLVILPVLFTTKTYQNERFIIHYRRNTCNRLGVRFLLLFCTRNNSHIISHSYYSFAFRRDKKSVIY
jgi:hypothetical protein